MNSDYSPEELLAEYNRLNKTYSSSESSHLEYNVYCDSDYEPEESPILNEKTKECWFRRLFKIKRQ